MSAILVSAIIPARNEEASIARAVESVAAQPEIDEVIVVDDGSTDGTARILEELRSRLPKLKVLQAGELPAGWVGKNHAVAVGAAAAKGDWLLFTDADTYHLPGAMQRALADAAEHKAVLVSYSPEQEMEAWWERALIPFVYCRLGRRFSFERVNDPSLADAAANGQFILVLREVYETIGWSQRDSRRNSRGCGVGAGCERRWSPNLFRVASGRGADADVQDFRGDVGRVDEKSVPAGWRARECGA